MICSRFLRFLFKAALLVATVACTVAASAAELLMFTRAGCPYCVLWEREIEPIYGKTDEAITAPLRKVHTDRPMPKDAHLIPPVRVTPTFVLMDNGKEIGRFSGYNDDATFWANLGMLMRRLDERPPSDPLPAKGEIKTLYESPK